MIHDTIDFRTIDLDLVHAGQIGFHRPQCFLQAFRKGPTDGHGLADGFHCRRQGRFGTRKFLEGEARHLGDHIVDGGLEARGGDFGDIVVEFVKRITNRQFRGDFRNREAGRLRCQGRGTRDTRVHLDHDEAPIVRIDRKLYVGTTGLDTDFPQTCDRGIPHDLIFFVSQRQRRRHGYRVAGVNAHRIDIFDRADNDAVIRFVADDLHFEFFPAEYRFLDQHFGGRRGM